MAAMGNDIEFTLSAIKSQSRGESVWPVSGGLLTVGPRLPSSAAPKDPTLADTHWQLWEIKIE
jgi:hypothetical protein